MTTEFSWRYVFAARGRDRRSAILLAARPAARRGAGGRDARPRLDVVGVLLSSLGLGLVVFGILKSSEWGLIEPRGALTIGGEEITPFGFSAVPFLILAGVALLAAFVLWEERRERLGQDTLLDRSLLRIAHLRAGLTTLMMQQLILLGTFFVLPVYLQVVLGLDAFETGKRLFPMSVAMFLAALAGPRLAAGFAPKRVAQAGCSRSPAASVLLLGHDRRRARRGGRSRSRWRVFGIGAGLLLSQLGNVIMSSVDPAKTNEAGGLQGTAQNLGASLGTALIGAVLLAALTTASIERVERNPAISPAVRERRSSQVAEAGMPDRPRGRRGAARRSDAGVPRRPGGGDRRRLRRGAAARAGAGDRGGRRVRAARALVHARPTRAGRVHGCASGLTPPSGGRRWRSRRGNGYCRDMSAVAPALVHVGRAPGRRVPASIGYVAAWLLAALAGGIAAAGAGPDAGEVGLARAADRRRAARRRLLRLALAPGRPLRRAS